MTQRKLTAFDDAPSMRNVNLVRPTRPNFFTMRPKLAGHSRRYWTKSSLPIFVMVVLLFWGAVLGDAQAQTNAPGSATAFQIEKVGEILLVFLVLSMVFEVALTPIFNWRIFLKHFEGKGVKTPVTVGLAFIVFWSYGLDVVRDLLVALGHPAPRTVGGQFLTALLIAGGSDGVLRIFTKLGIRNPAERKERAEEARRG